MNANEWWHSYVKEHGISPSAMEAYNAGMERAADIATSMMNEYASPSWDDACENISEAIRKEIT